MTDYRQLTITIEGVNQNYQIYFAFNEYTIFDDLLVYFSEIYPEKNICPCCKIQYLNTSNNTYCNLSMNQKVKDFINNKGYTQYKISNPNKDCEYNDSNRDIF